MRTVYSACFDIGAAGTAPALRDVVEAVRVWVTTVEQRPMKQFPPKIAHDFFGIGRSSDGKKLIETYKWDAPAGGGGWALRWTQPGEEPDEPSVITEIILRQSENSLAISVQIGYQRSLPRGYGLWMKRPRLVPQLLNQFGGEAGIPLAADAINLSKFEIDRLLETLQNDRRKLPLVLFSVHPDQGTTVCRVDLVADILAGLAHVFTLADVEASFVLTDSVGKGHSCFNGATKIYWPGWTPEDNPFKHRLLWPEDLTPGDPGGDYRGANKLLHILATAAAAIPLPPPRSFEEAKAGAESKKVENEALEILEDIDRVNRENSALKVELDDARAKIVQLERRIVPGLRIAVFTGSAERHNRWRSWERSFENLSKKARIAIDAYYFDIEGKWPEGNFDYWILDQKTVAGHKELKDEFGPRARKAGAQWFSVRDTTDIDADGPQLKRGQGY